MLTIQNKQQDICGTVKESGSLSIPICPYDTPLIPPSMAEHSDIPYTVG